MTPSEPQLFTYDRSLAPMIWALIALSIGELCLVHLLVALLWSRWAALVLSIASLVAIAWLVRLIRSFRRHPVVVSAAGATLCVGDLRRIIVPADAVLGLRQTITAETLRQRDVLKLSLVAFPNVVIDLKRPMRVGRREISTIAHRLDDPAGFTRAMDRLIADA